MSYSSAVWRYDLDAVQFSAANGGNCLVHRLAFRTLLCAPPTKESCLAFLERNRGVFEAAANSKILAGLVGARQNFHLNSRQIRRCMTAQSIGGVLA